LACLIVATGVVIFFIRLIYYYYYMLSLVNLLISILVQLQIFTCQFHL